MTKPTIYILLLILIAACGQKKEQKNNVRDNLATTDSLTAQIEEINDQEKIVGFSVVMVDTTRTLYNKGFGFSDKASKKEYSKNTIQYVASISKTLIGISLFKAQELGKLNLDEPINKYLPFEVVNPNFPESQISIRQLAIHTSSIIDSDKFWENDYLLLNKDHTKGAAIPKYFNESMDKIPISEFMEKLLSKDGKLNNGESYSTNEPNQKFDYSNIGSTLCALIIENAMGIPYQIFTKKYILEPLKMDSSGWTIEDVNSQNRSTLYATNELVMADYTTVDFPSSGLITSSTDLGKFLTEIIKGYSGKGFDQSKL
ncbi:serine hydrolase [Galbibacter sp. EGI 63066]|uniref:serine hydrolase domain-containing protein n=1 Tax=Galbibacter sp. EGI 63066 TaxID=2993559 RepID=UPI0022496411|nr:serine hydrolase domain-containing protein [Galbibacter sp. EGI 63066]MCX2680077.1 serine hydrolase [Galbibacter sp. EGI 63066]